jgi:hypothetical protein
VPRAGRIASAAFIDRQALAGLELVVAVWAGSWMLPGPFFLARVEETTPLPGGLEGRATVR